MGNHGEKVLIFPGGNEKTTTETNRQSMENPYTNMTNERKIEESERTWRLREADDYVYICFYKYSNYKYGKYRAGATQLRLV